MRLARSASVSSAAFAFTSFLIACGTSGGGEGSAGAGSGAGGSPSGGVSGSGNTSGSGGTMATGGTAGTGGTTSTGGSTAGSAGTVAATGGASAGAGGSTTSGTGGSATGGSASGTGGSPPGGGRGGAGGGGTGASSGAGSGGSGGAMPSTGCGKAPPASNRYSIDVSGTMREYILRVPPNYDQNRPYRFVFAWHPLGGSAQQTAGNGSSGYYGLQGVAGNDAILVSAEGLQQNGSGNRGWWNTNGGDIAFLRAMLDRFKAEMCIDERRIFSTGFSFGGMMSNAVGCTGLVRAIAPMAGNSQVSGCTNGTQSVAMMGFHGVNDSVVAISGGRQARDIFVQRNQCMQEASPVTPSWCDGVSQNNQPCSCVSYQGCAAGYPVIWCEFNADHTPAPNSATTIWNFFSQF